LGGGVALKLLHGVEPDGAGIEPDRKYFGRGEFLSGEFFIGDERSGENERTGRGNGRLSSDYYYTRKFSIYMI